MISSTESTTIPYCFVALPENQHLGVYRFLDVHIVQNPRIDQRDQFPAQVQNSVNEFQGIWGLQQFLQGVLMISLTFEMSIAKENVPTLN